MKIREQECCSKVELVIIQKVESTNPSHEKNLDKGLNPSAALFASNLVYVRP